MSPVTRRLLAVAGIAFSPGLMLSGCARGGGSPMAAPISASLSSSTVVVARDGTPTHVQIIIRSTSETALVSFTGMPTNVQAGYQASDTNPSGLLTFMATGKVTAGTYMSIITVNSAGQTTMVTFTVVVPAG